MNKSRYSITAHPIRQAGQQTAIHEIQSGDIWAKDITKVEEIQKQTEELISNSKLVQPEEDETNRELHELPSQEDGQVSEAKRLRK